MTVSDADVPAWQRKLKPWAWLLGVVMLVVSFVGTVGDLVTGHYVAKSDFGAEVRAREALSEVVERNRATCERWHEESLGHEQRLTARLDKVYDKLTDMRRAP